MVTHLQSVWKLEEEEKQLNKIRNISIKVHFEFQFLRNLIDSPASVSHPPDQHQLRCESTSAGDSMHTKNSLEKEENFQVSRNYRKNKRIASCDDATHLSEYFDSIRFLAVSPEIER